MHYHYVSPLTRQFLTWAEIENFESYKRFGKMVSSFTLLFHFSTMCLSQSTPKDPSSLANLKQVKSTHLHLNWTISFDDKNIVGSVLLDLETLEDNVDKVILDSSYLAIRRVSSNNQDLKVSYRQKTTSEQKILNN